MEEQSKARDAEPEPIDEGGAAARRPSDFNAPKEPAGSANDKPAPIEAPPKTGSTSASAAGETEPSKAMEIRRSFAALLTARLDVEPLALENSGISSDWNQSVYVTPEQVVDWAADQISAEAPKDLVEAGLFTDDLGDLRPKAGLAPGCPVVVLRDSPDGPPLGFYAGEWSDRSGELTSCFSSDVETRRLASAHDGVIIAASSTLEVAAWRRIGLAAIPTPSEHDWRAAPTHFWKQLGCMTKFLESPASATQANSIAASSLLQPTLVVSRLDPVSLEDRSGAELDSHVGLIRRFWEAGSLGQSASLGEWKPSASQISSIRKAIVRGTPLALGRALFASLRDNLYYIAARGRDDEPAADLPTLRKALTTIDSATPVEQRDEVRNRYLRQFDSDVVDPLVREALTMDSTEQRALATAQAGLMQIFGELQTDMTLAAALGSADPKRKSATVRDICQVSREIRSLIHSAKEESRGRRP
ncbi:MAG: hypothetical protein C0485_17745 [Pirellula sp.]|nr:hypothetical protein [Pirellula sp.]